MWAWQESRVAKVESRGLTEESGGEPSEVGFALHGSGRESEFAGEGFDEGEDFGEEFIPAGDLADAGFFEMGGG